RCEGTGHDVLQASEVATGRTPRIDDLNFAHVLHAGGTVRLPRLDVGALTINAATHRRPAIAPVHGASVNDGVMMKARADFLDMRLRNIRGMSICRPRLQRGRGSKRLRSQRRQHHRRKENAAEILLHDSNLYKRWRIKASL